MAKYPTPHISAMPEDLGRTVLMPGDPLRSKFIAENFLTNAKLVNNIRGVQGYTGTYDGVKVTVMASGMGMPAIGIYSYELYNFYDIDNIIRIGSAGAIREEVELRDLVFAMGCSTDSNFGSQFQTGGHIAPVADYILLKNAVETAEELKVDFHVGNIFSSDVFYNDDPEVNNKWAKMGCLCVEMETAALYLNAARAGKRALGMFTISDQIIKQQFLTAEERQNTFTQMMEVSLKTAVKMEKIPKL